MVLIGYPTRGMEGCDRGRFVKNYNKSIIEKTIEIWKSLLVYFDYYQKKNLLRSRDQI